MAYKKLNAEDKLTIINLFKPGKLTLAEIARITGYSANTVGKVISENILTKQKKIGSKKKKLW